MDAEATILNLRRASARERMVPVSRWRKFTFSKKEVYSQNKSVSRELEEKCVVFHEIFLHIVFILRISHHVSQCTHSVIPTSHGCANLHIIRRPNQPREKHHHHHRPQRDANDDTTDGISLSLSRGSSKKFNSPHFEPP
jgi:hypothetical protein